MWMIRLFFRVGFLAIALLAVGTLAHVAPVRSQTHTLGGDTTSWPGKFVRDSVVVIDVHLLAQGVYAAKVNSVWVGWIELPNGILMVDAAASERAAMALADTVRSRSGDRPFRYVVNTYPHMDHAGGDRYFASLGATIVVKDSAAAELDYVLEHSGEEGDALSRSGKKPVVKRIAKRLDVGDAKRPVQIRWVGTPAQSVGDLMVSLPKQNVLFAGDVVWNRSVPWMVDPGMNEKGWLAVLDSLIVPARTLDAVVPGHGVMAKPVDEVMFTFNYINDARDKAAQMAAWGTTLTQIRDTAYLGPYQDMEFYQEIHFMNMRRLYNSARGIKTPGRQHTGAVKKF